MKKLFSILFILFVLVPIAPQKAFALGDVVNISNTANNAIFPNITADNKGYLHVVWMEHTGSVAVNPGIFYSRWNGDTWSSALNISENTGYAENPSLVTDSARTVHMVWNDDTASGGLPQIIYRSRTEAGVLSAKETLPAPAGNVFTRYPEVTIDGSGNPTVVFFSYDTSDHVRIYQTTKSGGSWSAPVLVSVNAAGNPTNASLFSEITTDGSGNLHLVYWDTSEGIFYRKYSAGAWSSAFNIVTGNVEYVRMAVTPSGEPFVTWRSPNDTSVYVRWTISGVWQTAVALTASSSTSYWGYPIMGVTTDSSNRAHVGWGERDAGGLLDLKYRSYTGTWQSAQDVDLDNNEADSPFVYPDLWDNQHFAWTELNPVSGKWEIKYRVAEGTIQTLTTSGGTITASPFAIDQARLSVPSGALSNSTQIGIQVGPLPENVNPNVVTIPKAYTFRPHGLVFNTPATARIFYTNAEVAGADEALLQPWLWDSQTGQYTAQTVASRSTAQNWMEVSLSHFSLYGIAAPKVNTTWNTPSLKGNKLHYSFNLSYADGSGFRKLNDKNDDLTLNIKNSSENTVLTLEFKDKNGPKQKKGGLFEGEIDTKKVSLPSGTYTIEMLLNGSLINTQSINI